ncbi:hypothetical protein [Roseibium sp. TrichSKD4]|uniref:hypothetical protein n=1 Tax=Roseibium sp. TrichSKD4 TaxID=744980 RepID=UPI001112BD93|nr:hypothetical protein [Roseibium sp. TrichSKD4]
MPGYGPGPLHVQNDFKRAERLVSGQLDQREEMKMSEDVVYTFGFRDEAPHIIDSTIMDGDVDKIEYVDTTRDKGLNSRVRTH